MNQSATPNTMTTADIEQLIPHRAPFLWLDDVVSVDETHIHARKHLPASLDVFQGHYPHFPVMPGVLQCEAALQAAAVLIARSLPNDDGKVPVATRMNNVQFRRLVRPGETLDIEVEITERLADAFFLKGKVSVDGKVSTRLEFACTATTQPDA
ncbi:MAG: 3-hydroxyacyl-ACP dehydratase FabZ family protein [Planctomycetaceae bacterium]